MARETTKVVIGSIGAVLGAAIGAGLGTATTAGGRVFHAILGALITSAFSIGIAIIAQRRARPAVPRTPVPGDEEFSFAHLLVAQQETIKFEYFGELHHLMAELLTWLNEENQRVRIITGTGGVGKTRLAIELGHRAKKFKFQTLFVPRDADEAFIKTELATDRRLLVIVDYAEGRHLNNLLCRCAALPHVKALLLARAMGDWCEPFGRPAPAPHLLGQARINAVELPSLPADDQRETAHRAAQQFAAKLGIPTPSRIELSNTFDTFLELHMAVMIRLLSAEPADDLLVDNTNIYAELLQHESNYWMTTALALNLDGGEELLRSSLPRLAASVALLGIRNADELQALDLQPGDRCDDAWLEWVGRLYPPASPEFIAGSIQPDRLAEHLVVETFQARADLLAQRLANASHSQYYQAIEVLSRAIMDGFSARPLLYQTVTSLAEVFDFDMEPPPLDVLDAIQSALTNRELTEPQATLAHVVAKLLVETSSDSAPARARAHRQAATTAGKAGFALSGLLEAQKAHAVSDELQVGAPHQYDEERIHALVVHSNRSASAGQRFDAFRFAKEAVELARARSVAEPASDQTVFAQALTALAIRHNERGGYTEAVKNSSEALEIRQAQADAQGDPFSPSLARAKVNHSGHCNAAGNHSEALASAEEADEIYSILNVAFDGRYRDEHASALSNAAKACFDSTRTERAAEFADRCLKLRSELYKDNPRRNARKLAETYSNTAVHYGQAERFRDAVTFASRAVAILDEASKDPEMEDLRDAFSLALNTLLNAYTRNDQSSEAIATARRLVSLRRETGAESSGRHRSELAKSLCNCAQVLLAEGETAEAIKLAEEAEQLLETIEENSAGMHVARLERVREILRRARASDA